MHRSLRLVFAVVALVLSFAARAQLTIEIVGGAGSAIPIAIVPFGGEASFPLGISGIVGADLQRSGVFRTSLSQTRITFQLTARSARVTVRSRRELLMSFAFQNGIRLFGVRR